MLLHNLRHIPDPYTAHRGVKRLRAGHAMLIRGGSIVKSWRYWTPHKSHVASTPENLRDLLEESIALRLHADVPVGALLSGGIDSSAIVSLMTQFSSSPVNTYALGMDENDQDIVRARTMAKYLGTNHKEYYFDPEEQWEIFRNLIKIYGDPIMLLPLIHTYTLCRAVHRDGIKVVLNGNGADELFYGYAGHPRVLQLSRLIEFGSPWRTFLAPLMPTRFSVLTASPGQRKAAYYRYLASSVWANCLSEDMRSIIHNRAAEEIKYWGELCPSESYVDESNFAALMVENTHSVTIAGDLPAMANAVEMRSPFLDQNMIAFALATPAKMKIPDVHNLNYLKAILRDSVKDLMPLEIFNASKRGFGHGIQEGELLAGPWKKKAEAIFNEANTLDGLFSRDLILNNWKNFLNNKMPTSFMAKQLAIQTWASS